MPGTAPVLEWNQSAAFPRIQSFTGNTLFYNSKALRLFFYQRESIHSCSCGKHLAPINTLGIVLGAKDAKPIQPSKALFSGSFIKGGDGMIG